jgi:hypothetical protein
VTSDYEPKPTLYSYGELRLKRRIDAANQLEELITVAKQMVLDLRGKPTRESQEDADLTAYGRGYWLRKRLGYVVATLGVGHPTSWVTRYVEKHYGKLLTSKEETS